MQICFAMAGEKSSNKQVEALPDGRVLIADSFSLVETNAIVGSGGGLQKSNPPVKDSKLAADDEVEEAVPWARWGENDDFPLKLNDKLGYLGVLQSAVEVNSTMHYGAGVIWGRDVYENRKKFFVPEKVDFWHKLKRSIEVDSIMSDVVESLETYYFSIVEVILNNGKSDVASAKCLDTVYCRFKKKKGTADVTHVYYDSAFGSGEDPKDPTAIPIYDPTNPTKHTKFVLVMGYRCFGRFYYPEPNYYSCIRNGWADVAISVPKIIKSVYKNQISVKYLIKIPLESMKRKYFCWDSPPDCENEQQIMDWQLARMKEEQDAINQHLVSEENAGKGIVTFNDSREEGTGITIEPIKNFLDSNSEIINAAAANSEMLFAALVDPSAIGHGIPGGKNLSGSGSDKREARQAKQASLKRERLASLRFPNLLAVIYGLEDDLYPTYLDIDTSETLDQNPKGTEKPVVN